MVFFLKLILLQTSSSVQKFLINEQGQLVDFVAPREKPNSEKIIQWIEK